MLNALLAPTLGEILRRLGTLLEINAEEVLRNGLRVLGIWLLAWLAMRLVKLAARRI